MPKKTLGRKQDEVNLNPKHQDPKICRVIQNGEPCTRKAGTSGLCRNHIDWARAYDRPELSLTGLAKRQTKNTINLEVKPGNPPQELCRLRENDQDCEAPARWDGLCSDHFCWARSNRRLSLLGDPKWRCPGQDVLMQRESEYRLKKQAEDKRKRDARWEKVNPSGETTSFQLLVTVKNLSPPVWRRFTLPSDYSLHALHWAIQTCFDWDNDHLHKFSPPGTARQSFLERDPDYHLPNDEHCFQLGLTANNLRPGKKPPRVYSSTWTEHYDSREISLAAAMPAAGAKLVYTYDFGDDWKHEIELEKILSLAPPQYLKGSGNAPVEDSGGTWGYRPDKAQAYDAATITSAWTRRFKE